MRYIILITLLFLIPLIFAGTTFFDNPDDAFIMGNAPTGGVIIEETTGGATGAGGCKYEWNCTNWSECLPSGKQTRICANIGTCLDTYKTPEMEQNCTYTAPKVEEKKELEKEILDKNKIIVYFVIILIILFIILYLKKDYFKKLVKKIK